MWNSRLLWKLALAYTGLNLTATAILLWGVTGFHHQHSVDLVKQRLRDAATEDANEFA